MEIVSGRSLVSYNEDEWSLVISWTRMEVSCMESRTISLSCLFWVHLSHMLSFKCTFSHVWASLRSACRDIVYDEEKDILVSPEDDGARHQLWFHHEAKHRHLMHRTIVGASVDLGRAVNWLCSQVGRLQPNHPLNQGLFGFIRTSLCTAYML